MFVRYNLSMNYMQPARLSDSELYKLCQFYGLNAKIWLRKFAGLLPEVFSRGLHRRRGCASIHEFAKKLSGMNERTVDKILNLHKRLKDKPALLALLESGEQGWSKIEAVAFIATKENEEEIAEKVEALPFHALTEFVKNTREEMTGAGQAQNILQTPQVVERQFLNFSFHISPKSRAKLDLMKHMMEKRHRKTLTWDEAFRAWPIEPQKTIIQTVCPDCAAKKSKQNKRPIPTAIQKLIFATHGYTCAFPGCHKPYQELHHVYPWAKYKTHDSKQIYPLCKAHHSLAHAGLIANMHQQPENWRIIKTPNQSSIDKKVMRHQTGH